MTLNPIEADFSRRYEEESVALQRLEAAQLAPGERANLRVLKRISQNGVEFSLDRLVQGTADKRKLLVDEFLQFGAKAVLNPGSQRGGDFLNNQLRGQWAEDVARSLQIKNANFCGFGPSASAMPGEEDHRLAVRTFREIVMLEGKRPDLVGFDDRVWSEVSDAQRVSVGTWPMRLLEPSDVELLRQAQCGIEVKNSTWHYRTRREAGGGALSITVKDEEIIDLTNWSESTGLPVLFFQVLFDELYCMSFERMKAAIRRGYLYRPGDIASDKVRGAGGKFWHRFNLEDERHKCASVDFPSDSTAEVRVLDDGKVIPYIAFKPARATCLYPDAYWTELSFAD
jgi:hypothetical protein